jgi:flagellar hook-associated protein 2
MASAIDGLVSGLDTTSIINNLMSVEARPQTLLKSRLSDTQAKATAYRAVNTRFDAIRTAAEALTATSLEAARTARTTSADVTATASATAARGSVSFTVENLAAAQTTFTSRTWSSTTASVTGETEPTWPIQVIDANGAVTDTITIPEGASLVDVVSKINAAGYGFQAQIVQTGDNGYRIKIDGTKTGADNGFRLGLTRTDPDNPGATVVDETAFTTVQAARDAEIDLGGGVRATSSSNTFADLLPGTAVTVGKRTDGPVTVSVGTDTSAVAGKVQALVDAVNGALGLIKGYTVSTAGSATATLQGDSALVSLSGQLLSAVSTSLGGASASQVGLQLTRDGKLTFDAATFTAKLAADPALATRLISGTADSTVGGVTTPGVQGIAGRLQALAKTASDSSTGTLVALAKGRDTLAKDIQDKIDAFDIRLAQRKATLTAQFTALETSLNTIKNQSSWLSSQIGQLYNPNKSS